MKRIGLALLLLLAGTDAARAGVHETPVFQEEVANGRLPKAEERVPRDLKVVVMRTVGSPGGELRMLMAGPKDTRMMVVYGYARLVGYTPSLKIEPDILKSIEVEDGRIVRMVEKPDHPPSDLVQTGCYMYDDRLFEFIRTLTPSARGELEVTDLNNIYIDEGTMTYDVLEGWWTDAGTPITKLRASILVARSKGVDPSQLGVDQPLHGDRSR